jgi:TonB family protein
LVDAPIEGPRVIAPSEKSVEKAETHSVSKIPEYAKKKETVTKKTKKYEDVIKSQKSRIAMPEPIIKEKPQPYSSTTQIKGEDDKETADVQGQDILQEGSNVANSQGTYGTKLEPGDAILGGPAVDITNFKYDYYLDIVRNRVNNRWNQPIEYNHIREALIEFIIHRNGKIDNIRISESSGDNYFDQTALRAVSLSNPFPPLPPGYKDSFLRVRYRFIFGRKG